MKPAPGSPLHLASEPEVKAALDALRPKNKPAPEPAKKTLLKQQVEELREEARLLKERHRLRNEVRQLKLAAAGPAMRRPDVKRAIEIALEVVKDTSFSYLDLCSRLRTADICAVRFEYFKRARAEGLTLSVIGLAVAKDHGTVLHGLRTLAAREAMGWKK